MKCFHMAIFLPALIFWVPFSFLFRIANQLTPKEIDYGSWFFNGVSAHYTVKFYDFPDFEDDQ